jgi:hypothetical protein
VEAQKVACPVYLISEDWGLCFTPGQILSKKSCYYSSIALTSDGTSYAMRLPIDAHSKGVNMIEDTLISAAKILIGALTLVIVFSICILI